MLLHGGWGNFTAIVMGSNMRRSTKLALAGFALVVAGSLSVVLIRNSDANRFNRNYKALQIRMRRSEVDALLGKNAEYELAYESHRICYYQRPFLGAIRAVDHNNLPPSRSAASLGELPYIYGAAQVLFDRDDTVLAFTMNGEDTRIMTVHGAIPGDRLDRLPEAFLE